MLCEEYRNYIAIKLQKEEKIKNNGGSGMFTCLADLESKP